MEPTYSSGQLLIVNKVFDELRRGDVIAVKCESLNAIIIKRIVGIPGDKVRISDGTLYVNDIKSSNIPNDVYIEYAGIAGTDIFLQWDEYFVMGDNISQSKDSRYDIIGLINQKDVIGVIIK